MATLRVDERALTRKEIKDACWVAQRAFMDDPFFCHLSPGPKLRKRGLYLFFLNQLLHFGKGGRIITVRNESDVIVGVSAWLPNGCYPQSALTQIAQIPGVLRSMYRRPLALVDGTKYLNEMAKKHPKDPHWYLFLLVAEPEIQRSGIGTMLMQHAFNEIDPQGLPVYLETQNEDNIAYYQRFGFEPREPLTPVQDGPPLLRMWRNAR
jgi:ribosomal protein S18 acetylase RimI-like enzyme